MTLMDRLRRRAQRLKSETCALFLAARHPGTPWYAKLVVAVIVAYAISPIDLIPDFIPVLGYIDDLILIPVGIALAIRLIPPAVLAECRVLAAQSMKRKPVSRIAGAAVLMIWSLLAMVFAAWLYDTWGMQY